MLDDSDADLSWFVALFADGPWGWLFLVIAVIVSIVVAGNHAECGKKICSNGQPARLMDHTCLCVQEVR